MALPQINATLVRVTGGATSEDYDQPAGAGAPLWTGAEGVYWQEKRERITGDQADVIVTTSLIVRTSLRVWAAGEVIELEDGRTGRVQAVEARSLPGIPDQLQTTRLTLEPQ